MLHTRHYMEHPPELGTVRHNHARAERIIIILQSLKLLISYKGRENTFAIMYADNSSTMQIYEFHCKKAIIRLSYSVTEIPASDITTRPQAPK